MVFRACFFPTLRPQSSVLGVLNATALIFLPTIFHVEGICWPVYDQAHAPKGIKATRASPQPTYNACYPESSAAGDPELPLFDVRPPAKCTTATFNFSFCYVAKVASLQFRRLLQRMSGFEEWNSTKKTASVHVDHFSSVNEFESQIGHQTSAVFVREPASRFLSAYLDFKKEIKKCVPPTVEEALVELGASKYNWDRHFAPQLNWCGLHQYLRNTTFIGHFENVAADTRSMLELVDNGAWNMYGASGWHGEGNTHGALFENPSEETTFHATHASLKWCEYFNQSDLDLLYDLYQMDYEAFGYAKPVLPLECKVRYPHVRKLATQQNNGYALRFDVRDWCLRQGLQHAYWDSLGQSWNWQLKRCNISTAPMTL